MNGEFIVKTSVQKTIPHLLGCLLFVLAGVFIVFEVEGLIPTIAGLCCVGFFGLGFFVLLYRVLDRRPRIIIDEKGITDRLLGVGRIDWEDIKFVKLNSDSKNSSLFLKLVNSGKSSKILSNSKNRLYNFNGDLDFGILSLDLTGIDMKPEKVYEIILKYIPEKHIINSDRMYEDFDTTFQIK